MEKTNPKLPASLYVFICDSDEDGTPIYAAVENFDEITEDMNGELIGKYRLDICGQLRITRELV